MNLVLKDALRRFRNDWESLDGGAVFRLELVIRDGNVVLHREHFKVKEFTSGWPEVRIKILRLYDAALGALVEKSLGRLSREHRTLILRGITVDHKPVRLPVKGPDGSVQSTLLRVSVEYDFQRRAGDRLAVNYAP